MKTLLIEFAKGDNGMMYEIRNAKENGFGGNYDCYVHNYYLNAKDAEAAITECNLLQDKHDAAHIAEFGEDESYLNAPRYVACLWEIDAEGNERQIEV